MPPFIFQSSPRIDSNSGKVRPGGSRLITIFSLGVTTLVKGRTEPAGVRFWVTEAGIESTPFARLDTFFRVNWRGEEDDMILVREGIRPDNDVPLQAGDNSLVIARRSILRASVGHFIVAVSADFAVL